MTARGTYSEVVSFLPVYYICQAELLAYLCAYLTFPDLLEGHLIHHFGDNMAAISGVVKGGSSLPDSARLIHAIHLQVLRLRCYP